MLLLARKTQSWPNRSMAVQGNNEAADRRRKGQALRALRRRIGLTQEDAAKAYDVTVQAWQNYEGGKRHLSDAKLRDLVAALGSTREEFDLELAKIPDTTGAQDVASGMAERASAQVFQLPLGGIAHGGPTRPPVNDEAGGATVDLSRYFAAGTEVLQLGGTSMVPYAEPGGFVTFNRNDPPRRGQGCVIELKTGLMLVKRFEHYSDDHVVVTELWPEEKRLEYPLDEVKGVYLIGGRFG